MPREGTIDAWSGQRPAFPLEIDPSDIEHLRAIEYIQKVRQEAQSLAMHSINLKRSPSPYYPTRPSIADSASDNLDYSQPGLAITEIRDLTNSLFEGRYQIKIDKSHGGDKLAQMYKDAHEMFKVLEDQHPEECTSLATWKMYTANNWPIPLNHMDTFRLYKYLTKWCSAKPPRLHFIWAWSLLLRTPDILDGDEISVLRDLSRSLTNHVETEPLAIAFIRVVGTVFRQSDLL